MKKIWALAIVALVIGIASPVSIAIGQLTFEELTT